MTTAILVISSLCLVASVTAAWFAFKMFGMVAAIIYGTQEAIGLADACYSHLNYTNSALKLVLDDIETRNTKRFQSAIENDDFQMATYYKSLLESITKLKTMTNEDIEGPDN